MSYCDVCGAEFDTFWQWCPECGAGLGKGAGHKRAKLPVTVEYDVDWVIQMDSEADAGSDIGATSPLAPI